jgi:hypothetical protein
MMLVSISRIGLVLVAAAITLCAANGQTPAQGPSRSPSSPAVTPSATASPSPTASPFHSPNREEIVNSLTPADVQTALSAVKKNFTNPEAVDDAELNRATLDGLLVRLSKGLVLIPPKTPNSSEPGVPLYSEILEGHIGYVRPGTINGANLQALDKRLADFAPKKVDALLIDLRASDAGDFASAADFVKRFVPKGKALFSLRKQDKQDKAFVSDRDPAYSGLLAVLVDSDTAGSAEAVADALRAEAKALTIGQPTAGGGVEYSDVPLPSGKILRVAVAQCIGADGRRLYPEGITPDLPVDMSPVDKRQIFRLSAMKGIAQFTREVERPHLNEAALIAGTNPELESSEQRRSRSQANALIDPVLERGIDLITSLEIYRKR